MFRSDNIPTARWYGLAVLLFTFAVFAFVPANDPDFGWHLAAGKYYIEELSLPDRDIFSHTMPSYRWVNHEYLTDAVVYILYRAGGNTTIVLSLAFVALAAVIYLILLPRAFSRRVGFDERLLIGLSALFMTWPFFGPRPQVVDWAGVILVYLIWTRFEKTRASRGLLWCVPLFLVWANLHGGFPFGFFILALLMMFYLSEDIISKKETYKHNFSFMQWWQTKNVLVIWFLAIVVLSAAATLVNPYGYELHKDIWRMSRESSILREYVTEWKPAAITSLATLPFFSYVILLLLFVMSDVKSSKSSLRTAPFVVMLLVLALSTMRFIPFFVFLSLPLMDRYFARNKLFIPGITAIIFAAFLVSLAYAYRLNAAATLVTHPSAAYSERSTQPLVWQRDFFYGQAPSRAIEFLKTQRVNRLFNEHDWGGTLLWAMPDTPVFIDGRMPFWKEGERHIMRDYVTISMAQPGWFDKVQEYDIRVFLIRASSPLAGNLQLQPQLWHKRYDDGYATIFERK